MDFFVKYGESRRSVVQNVLVCSIPWNLTSTGIVEMSESQTGVSTGTYVR